jgi:hypothetical protein
MRGLTAVPLARSEKPAVGQSIQPALVYLQRACVFINGTAFGRRQALFSRDDLRQTLQRLKQTGRSNRQESQVVRSRPLCTVLNYAQMSQLI